MFIIIIFDGFGIPKAILKPSKANYIGIKTNQKRGSEANTKRLCFPLLAEQGTTATTPYYLILQEHSVLWYASDVPTAESIYRYADQGRAALSSKANDSWYWRNRRQVAKG